MNDPKSMPAKVNPWSRVLVAACAAFIFTVFLMVSTTFNRQAGALSRFFDEHGMKILAAEVGGILGLAAIALAVERRETQRRIEDREQSILRAIEEQAPDETIP